MKVRVTISFLNDTYRIIWDKPSKARTDAGRRRACDIATTQALGRYPKADSVKCEIVDISDISEAV